MLRRALPRPAPRRGPLPPRASSGGVYERVLRYPDGKERRIRYPVDDDDEAGLAAGSGWASSDAAWQPARWPAGAAAVTRPPPAARPTRPRPSIDAPPSPDVPATPADLVRAAATRAADAAAADAALAACYAVLDGCPWPLPRTLYLLASAPAGDADEDAPATPVTFRVRRPRPAAAAELASLLGRSAPFLDVSHLVDGILAFDCEATAAAFADALAARPAVGATTPPASLAALPSHALFRAAADAASVVVLVRAGAGGRAPDPAALAAALRCGGTGAAQV